MNRQSEQALAGHAPLFAAAFATHDTWQTFLVGSAATRMMANFFLGLQRGKSVNRMFSADSEALAWLQAQR